MTALITVCSFTARVHTFRRMTKIEEAWVSDSTNLVTGSYFYSNILVLFVALFYWIYIKSIDWRILGLSLAGALVDMLSINCMYVALSRGPGGPITAIGSMSSVLTVIIEAVRNDKAPSWIEIIALVFGVLGALEFVVPKFVH